MTAIVLVSSFLVVASLQTVELQWQQLKWLALLPMLSLFLDEPAQERSGFKGRVRALWSGVALAIALAIMIVVANRAGWTFDTQADSDGWTSLVASGVDVALFLISLAGLLTIHDIALRRAEAELEQARQLYARTLAQASGDVTEFGGLTAFLYSTDEDYIARAEAAYARAGAQLTTNLTGAMPLNFAAAYSDYHVTGLNPAGNAALTSLAFVASRFCITQSRRPARTPSQASRS